MGAAVKDYVSRWTAPVINTAQTNLGASRRAEAAGAGTARVDAMRTQFSTLLAHETSVHTEQVNHASQLANLVLVLGIGATLLFLGVMVLMAVRTQSRLVAPLRQLARAAGALAAGDLTIRVPGPGDRHRRGGGGRAGLRPHGRRAGAPARSAR
jgi:HAMP domain-containing protein